MSLQIPFLLVAIALLPIAAAAEEFVDSIPVHPGGTLHVDVDAGSIEVEIHDADEVRAWARARGIGSGGVGFTLRADGNDVYFEGSQGGWLAAWGADAEVRLRVPRRFSLDASTNGGSIEIEEVEGSVRARTSGGPIVVEGAVGSVDAETSGGDIEAENVRGELRARTSGGSIQVNDVEGGIDAETSGGNLELHDVWGPVQGRTSGGSVSVRFTRPPSGSIETSGGGIDVELPEGAALDLDAETSGGKILLDSALHFQGEMSPARARGALNGGGSPLRLRTSGGNIEIGVN